MIAEAGVNHNGDVDMAHRLIDAAADAGADAVKFQTFVADRLVRRDTPKVAYQVAGDDSADQHAMIERLELSEAAFAALADHARRRGLVFLSTAFDPENLSFLVGRLAMPTIKVPSGEAVNVPYLRAVAGWRRPVLLSTGMCDLDEVRLAVRTLEAAWAAEGEPDADGTVPPLTLLQCTSCYPTPVEEAHLRSMTTLATAFGRPVGFSDHTEGTAAAIAAVALGARAVEKHFTLDRGLPGPDHRASLEPAGLARMIAGIREVEAALGSAEKARRPCERDAAPLVRRSLVARERIPEGRTIAAAMLITLRPEDGIPARDLDLVVGRPAWRAFAAGEVLRWD